MFDRFTDNARRMMGRARDIAQQSQHEYIGSEHMLMALLTQKGTAREILNEFILDQDELRSSLEAKLGETQKSEVQVTGQLPFTPVAKDALMKARAYSARIEHDHIGTEHVLYGLAEAGPSQNRARELLEERGITPEAIELMHAGLEGTKDKVYEAGPALRISIMPVLEDARELYERVQEIVDERQHSQIVPEHLLLALLDYKESPGRKVLDRFDIDEAALREALDAKLATIPQGEYQPGQVAQSGVREVFAAARAYATREGYDTVGTEHILYGLVGEGSLLAEQVTREAIVEQHHLMFDEMEQASFDARTYAMYGVRLDFTEVEPDVAMCGDLDVVDLAMADADQVELSSRILVRQRAYEGGTERGITAYIGIPVSHKHEPSFINGRQAHSGAWSYGTLTNEERDQLIGRLERFGITEEHVGAPLQESVRLYVLQTSPEEFIRI